jgi:hypothetical protein
VCNCSFFILLLSGISFLISESDEKILFISSQICQILNLGPQRSSCGTPKPNATTSRHAGSNRDKSLQCSRLATKSCKPALRKSAPRRRLVVKDGIELRSRPERQDFNASGYSLPCTKHSSLNYYRYRWVEEKKERKRVYDEMHLYDRNQTPPTASYAPDDRLRQPNGRYRRIIFTNIQGVHRTRPRPATIETPERNERRPGCQQNPPARQTPQRAQHCSQGRNQLMSPPSSANVSRTRIGEGAHHTCNIRPCRREPTRNELLQGLRQAAMDDLLRSGMNRHDYAVFLKKMNALKEFGPG